MDIKENYSIADLENIIRRLRAKDGCSWDKAQTHESIRHNLIEEAYELADAIDKKDDVNMCEETGDLILQAVFHSVMAEERGAFDLSKAVDNICKKLISRHTHIFGGDKAENSEKALEVWDKNKKKEKGYATVYDEMRAVPMSFTALMRAEKIQKKAARHNFDFESVDGAFDKLHEEIDELKAAVKNNSNIEEECGDMLFAAVNVVRMFKQDCELCLNASAQKFMDRFKTMEELILKDNKVMKNMTLAELDIYYNESKKLNGKKS